MDDLISRAAAICCLGNSPEEMCMPWSEVERMLRALPAVDAVPVVHGRWEEHEDYNGDSYYTCSVCNCCWVLIDGTPEDNNMHFCPNCGARMGAEEPVWN